MKEESMKRIFLFIVVLVGFVCAGYAKVFSNDPLTGLVLIPNTSSGKYLGNEPTEMPTGTVCKSTMHGNFYSLYSITMDDAASWYASHLSGFKKVQGYESHRMQIAFYNADGTIVIFVTSERGPESGSAKAYSVAYQRYQPGITEKTIVALTKGNIVCP